MLRCVRKEGKVFLAFGSKDTSFVHSKVKIYYKVWTSIQVMFNSRLQCPL
jgi:hypothetical protein